MNNDNQIDPSVLAAHVRGFLMANGFDSARYYTDQEIWQGIGTAFMLAELERIKNMDERAGRTGCVLSLREGNV